MHRALPLALSLALAGTTSFATAQEPTPALQMLGLAPGLVQSDLQQRVAKIGGKMACRPSSVDKRFAECTANVASGGRTWELRASVVEGTSAVILLKTTISAAELEKMRADLTTRIGRPNYRQQGPQQSYEWIRSGRMLRMTSRAEKGAVQLSVSLVEGSVLDALQATR